MKKEQSGITAKIFDSKKRESFKRARLEDAACVGRYDLFFSSGTEDIKELGETRRYRERKAKEVCRSCPVQKNCLHYALESKEESGVWGGKNPRERNKLRKAGEQTYQKSTKKVRE